MRKKSDGQVGPLGQVEVFLKPKYEKETLMLTTPTSPEIQQLPIHIRTSDGGYVLTPMGRYKTSEDACSTIRKLARFLFSPRQLARLCEESQVRLLVLCLALVSSPTGLKGVDHYLEFTSDPDPYFFGGFAQVFRIRLKSGLLHITGECIRHCYSKSGPQFQGIECEDDYSMLMDFRASVWNDGCPTPPDHRAVSKFFSGLPGVIMDRWKLTLGDLSHCVQEIPPFSHPHTLIDLSSTGNTPESLLQVFKDYDQLINPNDQSDPEVMEFPKHLWGAPLEEDFEFD